MVYPREDRVHNHQICALKYPQIMVGNGGNVVHLVQLCGEGAKGGTHTPAGGLVDLLRNFIC